MADQTPATAQVEGPPPDNSQAIKPPPVTIPGPDEMFAKIRKSVETLNPDALRPIGESAPKPDPDALPLNLDPKVMRTLGRLQKEAREGAAALAKVAELEPLKTDADFAKAIRDMWKGTPEQRLEALAKLSGRDGTDELAALVQFFYERDQATAAETTEDGKPKPAPTPELKSVLDRLDAVTKELADLKAGKDAETQAQKDAKFKANAEAAAGFVGKFLSDNAKKYEVSARKENAAEAVDLVQSGVLVLALKDGLATKNEKGEVFMREGVTDEQAADLYHRAAEEVEEELRGIGRRFAAPSDARALLFDPNKYARPLSRPTVTLKKEGPLPSNIPEREKELRQRYLEKFERGEFKRS